MKPGFDFAVLPHAFHLLLNSPSEFFRPLMAKAFVGGATVKEVMDQGTAKWNEYKSLLGQ